MRAISFFLLFIAMAVVLAATPAWANESAEEGDKKEKAIGSGPTYVEISPFIIPVIGDNGPREMVTLIIVLEVADLEKAEYVRRRLPKLNDAYMRALYGALDRNTIRRRGVIDVSMLKGRLADATLKAIGPGYVDDVLVQAVGERRFTDNG
jgi:flagellar basal body-associated protein FliL